MLTTRTPRRLGPVVLAVTLLVAPPLSAQEQTVVTGLSAPESAVHDSEADVYLVSNINGGLADADDNGFISRVAPDGTILDLKWIDGEDPDVTLHAPKGSAIYGDRLYVADLDTVRAFDRATGASLDAWVVPGADFLNDVAVGADGTVYVTDTAITLTPQGPRPSGTPAIYRLDADGQSQVIVEGPGLALPNGIVETPQGLVMVTVGANRVVTVDADGTLGTLAELPAGQLDGVVVAGDGSLLVSSIAGSAVYRVDATGAVSEAITDMPAADIGIDLERGRILIPQLGANQLVLYTLP